MPHYKGRQLETIANQREDGRGLPVCHCQL